MSKTISDQIREALKARNRTQKDLASMLSRSLRTAQHKLQHNDWSVKEVEMLSGKLDWEFKLDTRSDSANDSTQVNEGKAQYSSVKPQPIIFNLTLDAAEVNSEKISRILEEWNELIKKYQD